MFSEKLEILQNPSFLESEDQAPNFILGSHEIEVFKYFKKKSIFSKPIEFESIEVSEDANNPNFLIEKRVNLEWTSFCNLGVSEARYTMKITRLI